MVIPQLENITIDGLWESNTISTRTRNCCNNAGFKTLLDVVLYYKSGHSFQNIRNVGKRTCLELEYVCKEYNSFLENSGDINQITEEEQNKDQEPSILKNLSAKDVIHAIQKKFTEGKTILSFLNDCQRKALRNEYARLIETHSIRTRNRLRLIGYESFLVDYLFTGDNTVLEIRGLGKKSLSEVSALKKEIKNYIIDLIGLSEKDLSLINFMHTIGETKPNEFIYTFYEKHNHLPMLWIFEQQLISDDNPYAKILTDWFPVFQQHNKKKLEEIAKTYNNTKERIRQIRNDVFYQNLAITDRLYEHNKDNYSIKCFKLLRNQDQWTYVLGHIEGTHYVNKISEEITNCLEKEKCNFSVEFVFQLIAYIFRDTFSIFGGFTLSNNTSWKATYLISRQLSDVFDFEAMKAELHKIIFNNNEEFELNVNDYITKCNFWKRFCFSKIDEITNVVKSILLHEFGLYSLGDNRVVKIPAQKRKSTSDILYDILKLNGKPMHIKEIFTEFKKMLPNHKYTNPEPLRNFLYSNELISHIKRSSTYVLKEWPHIRGGTIRDAMIEYLENYDVPKTADEITKYVLQYFPTTNLNSVRTSMSNEKKRFVKFENNLFGLTCKEYPNEYKMYQNQRPTYEQRLFALEDFIATNNRFPSLSSDDTEEQTLARWWRRVNSGKMKLTQFQKNEANRVNQKYIYCNFGKGEDHWHTCYKSFKQSLIDKQRIPSSKEAEKPLNDWWSKATANYDNERLNKEQRKKYIELLKLIHNVKR